MTPLRRHESTRRPYYRMSMFGALVVPLLMLCFWLNPTPTVLAEEIVVTGACGLVDAITAANTNTATGGCSAGEAGSDTLVLDADGIYTRTLANNSFGGQGGNALPVITSTITISGFGSSIERDPALGCTDTTPNFRIFYVENPGHLTLNDVTVRNGCIPDNYGGALYNHGGQVTAMGSHFTANQSGSGGGAIHNMGYLTLGGQSSVTNNISGGDGGGISSAGGGVTIQDSDVGYNVAHNLGGGINITTGWMIIKNGQVYFNVAENSGVVANHGGGVNIDGGAAVSVTQQSVISGNRADDGGGGFSIIDGTLAFESGSVISNTAKYGGGFFVSTNLTVTVVSSNVITNEAEIDGGGAYIDGGAVLFINSRLLGNRVGSGTGGAAYHASGREGRIEFSCIIRNGDFAIFSADDGAPTIATGNWWGTESGPSGAGAGFGDSVSIGVDYSNFLKDPILGCSNTSRLLLPVTPK